MPAYKLDNGKWSASFYYRLPDGSLKQKFKRSFDTEDDALRYEKEFRRAPRTRAASRSQPS